MSFSAFDFIIRRFVFFLWLLCSLAHHLIFFVFKIPSAVVASDGFFCITWSKGLFLSLLFTLDVEG